MSRNCLIVVVFAVPGPPTNSRTSRRSTRESRACTSRTESSVGITSDANLGFSCTVG